MRGYERYVGNKKNGQSLREEPLTAIVCTVIDGKKNSNSVLPKNKK